MTYGSIHPEAEGFVLITKTLKETGFQSWPKSAPQSAMIAVT